MARTKTAAYARVMPNFRPVGYSSFVITEFWSGRTFVSEE